MTRMDIKVPPDYHVQSVIIHAEPDVCPVCHHNQIPRYIDGNRVDESHVDLVYQCTNADCRHAFIARYFKYVHSDAFWVSSLVPITPEKASFPEEIAQVSPDFCSIFAQADLAEKYELTLIAGCGYRKSLEFIIKDYLSSIMKDETEAIRKTSLGSCIENWVDDPKIKASAKRAVWLGNDETHYSRKWEEKDLKDLKILIKLTMNWIESSILTKKYEGEMKQSSHDP